MILILSDGNFDKSSYDVFKWVLRHRGSVEILSSREFISSISFSMSIFDDEISLSLKKGNIDICLDNVNVIWNWRWGDYGLDNIYIDNCYELKRFSYKEIEVIKEIIFSRLKDKYWIGSKHINKIEVLIAAKNAGLKTPDTQITTSKYVLEEFMTKHDKIIIKPLSNPIFFSDKKDRYGMYTKELSYNILKSVPLHFFPILTQQHIEKDFEVRSFYIDKNFYSAAIISQDDEKTKVDFRNYNKETPNRVIPFQLPTSIEHQLQILMQNMSLDTGSIDIIYSKGEYYFLEINPVGQFDMISTPCNYNLDEKIAKYLIKKDHDEV